MTALYRSHSFAMNPAKRIRRNATAVMAGQFDVHVRDVLTSLLNGVGPYKEVEKDEEAKKLRKREKREREREKKKAKIAAKARQRELLGEAGLAATSGAPSASTSALPQAQSSAGTTPVVWSVRPTIQISRSRESESMSISPPQSPSTFLAPSTPGSTPGPSISSSTSRTSSKRPHTPDDYDYLDMQTGSISAPLPRQPRKKRAAVKKGWKGWVEGSPPPSEKLINLDAVPVLQERRTRSGKNFDAIGVGKEGWV